MKKLTVFIIVLALILTGVFGAVGINKRLQAKSSNEEQTTATDETDKKTDTTDATETADTEEAAEATEETAEETTEGTPDVDADMAYAEDVTEEDKQAFKDFLEQQPNVDEDMLVAFYQKHPELFEGYLKDPDGYYLPPLSKESLMITDEDRPFAAGNIGLVNHQIDDAVAYPFTLTAKQVQMLKAAQLNSTVDFSQEEITEFRNELFRAFIENPILLEGWMKLVCEQKIGTEVEVQKYWSAGKKFMKEYKQARKDGRGMNVWVRKINDEYYTGINTQMYAVALIELLFPKETHGMVLTAHAGNHFVLLPGDFNSQRQVAFANYEENLPSLAFTFRLKNGKIGIIIGANFCDKRGEVLNYTTTSKKAQKTTSSSNTTTKKKTEDDDTSKKDKDEDTTKKKTEDGTTAKTSTGNTTKSGGGSSTNKTSGGGSTSKTESKAPADDKANAVTDHQDDDPGPGAWTNDIGDSQSPTVEGSQAHANTVVNTDGGNPDLYDQGPAADATDNGTPPDTSAVENQIGTGAGTTVTSGTDLSTGQQASTTTNTVDGRTQSAPPVND